MEDILIKKSETDLARIYKTPNGYEVRFNLLREGDPTYMYPTEIGAKIAFAKRIKKYGNEKPISKWE